MYSIESHPHTGLLSSLDISIFCEDIFYLVRQVWFITFHTSVQSITPSLQGRSTGEASLCIRRTGLTILLSTTAYFFVRTFLGWISRTRPTKKYCFPLSLDPRVRSSKPLMRSSGSVDLYTVSLPAAIEADEVLMSTGKRRVSTYLDQSLRKNYVAGK